MTINRTSVDSYLKDGCGRCEHYQTPNCKVLLWTPILRSLRTLLLEQGLREAMKWGSPCYMAGDTNVAMIASMRDSCALSLFQGAELTVHPELLEAPGPNSHHARYIKLRTLEEFNAKRPAIVAILNEAYQRVHARSNGSASPKKPAPKIELPPELSVRINLDSKLRKAFAALTPGRQRSHALYVGGAKQAETRIRRAEQCVPDILSGRGFRERS